MSISRVSDAIPVFSIDQPVAQRLFSVVRAGSREMRDLTKIFNEILVPLYGSQEKALNQIGLAQDRVCHLLYEGATPIGVIAFKTIVSNEFVSNGVRNSIEIKSLFVVASAQNSGRGIGSILLDKVAEETAKLKINHDSFHVTVSSTKAESLNFFKKKGFRIVTEWNGRYIKGVTEYLLSRPNETGDNQKEKVEKDEKLRTTQDAPAKSEFEKKLASGAGFSLATAGSVPVAAISAALATSTVALASLGAGPALEPLEAKEKGSKEFPKLVQLAQGEQSWSPKLLHVIRNAHWDDIHVLKLLSDGSFVSGSKDNSIRKWNQRGQVIREVLDVEPINADQKERDWITAIEVLNDEYWISGDRSGRVRLWNTAGDHIKDLSLKLPRKGYYSYEKNQNRINSLVQGPNKQNPSFFVGFPTMFSEYNLIEGRTISVTTVHNNDWVYAIQPLTPTRNLVVTAGTLEVWEKTRNLWSRGATIYQEKPVVSSRSRGGSYSRGRGGRGGRGGLRGAGIKKEKKSRLHISALTLLDSSPNQVALGIFGGYTAVVDITRATTVREWKEHTGRIWSVENISKEVFASSAEDGYIKIWDTRTDRSISTLGKHIGGVSALLRLNENVLVAGACPQNPSGANEGAQLLFYDIRR